MSHSQFRRTKTYTETCMDESLRQAYDYWQDQPGSTLRISNASRVRHSPGANTSSMHIRERRNPRLQTRSSHDFLTLPEFLRLEQNAALIIFARATQIFYLTRIAPLAKFDPVTNGKSHAESEQNRPDTRMLRTPLKLRLAYEYKPSSCRAYKSANRSHNALPRKL